MSQRFPRLKYTLEGNSYPILPNFISTIRFSSKKVEIEINWTHVDFIVGSDSMDLYIGLSNIFQDCEALEYMTLKFSYFNVNNMKKMFS